MQASKNYMILNICFRNYTGQYDSKTSRIANIYYRTGTGIRA